MGQAVPHTLWQGLGWQRTLWVARPAGVPPGAWPKKGSELGAWRGPRPQMGLGTRACPRVPPLQVPKVLGSGGTSGRGAVTVPWGARSPSCPEELCLLRLVSLLIFPPRFHFARSPTSATRCHANLENIDWHTSFPPPGAKTPGCAGAGCQRCLILGSKCRFVSIPCCVHSDSPGARSAARAACLEAEAARFLSFCTFLFKYFDANKDGTCGVEGSFPRGCVQQPNSNLAPRARWGRVCVLGPPCAVPAGWGWRCGERAGGIPVVPGC